MPPLMILCLVLRLVALRLIQLNKFRNLCRALFASKDESALLDLEALEHMQHYKAGVAMTQT
jgi:hypothetical protein